MTAIAEYLYLRNSKICQMLQNLEAYCQQRNEYIHQLKGISKLESEKIIFNMRQILEVLKISLKPHPFEKINNLLNVQ